MGKTAGITILLNQNSNFESFLNTETTDLTQAAQVDINTFNAGTASYYSANNWDIENMFDGQNYHYQLPGESSADIILAVVKQITANIFNHQNNPLPEGASANANGIAAARPAYQNFADLSGDAAMATIANMLADLVADNNTAYTNTTIRQQLSGGITLHLFVASTNVVFDNGAFLSITMFKYDLVYSAKQNEHTTDEYFILQHEELIGKLEEALQKMQQKYSDAVAAGNDKFAKECQDLLQILQQHIQEYQVEIDDIKQKMATTKLR